MRIICFSFSFKHLVPESIICYLCFVGYRTTCSSSLLLCWLRDCHVSSAKHLFIYFNNFVSFLSQIFSSAAFQQEVQAGLPALEGEKKKFYAFPVFTETRV